MGEEVLFAASVPRLRQKQSLESIFKREIWNNLNAIKHLVHENEAKHPGSQQFRGFDPIKFSFT